MHLGNCANHLFTSIHAHQSNISSSLLTNTILKRKKGKQCLLSQILVYSVSERRFVGQPLNTLVYPPPKTLPDFLLLGFRHTIAHHLNKIRQLQTSILCIVVENFGKKDDLFPDHNIGSSELSPGLIQLMKYFLGCVQPYLQRLSVRIV